MIDAAGLLKVVGADGLKDAEYAYGIDIGCELGGIEGDLYVRLCCEVVDLGGLDFAYEFDERHGVGEVCVMEVKIRLSFKMSDALAEVY